MTQVRKQDLISIKPLNKVLNSELMTNSYKIFWLRAILHFVHEKKVSISFNEMLDYMICDSWEIVNDLGLKFGKQDKLEVLDLYLKEKYGDHFRKEGFQFLASISDPDIIKLKKQIVTYVPFRFQTPFYSLKLRLHIDSLEKSKNTIISNINDESGLIYYFSHYENLNTLISIDQQWAQYLESSFYILKEWTAYKLLMYLNSRNPGMSLNNEQLLSSLTDEEEY